MEMTDNQQPAQTEMPFAIVQGTPVLTPPKDLYIPPDALEVFLEAFEGPLDLLLYLIKRQNLDVLDIPISRVTEQYMSYIEMMQVLQIELAAEYLVMAAMLAEIKSRMLLPRPVSEEEEDDPRAELVRRLQEYERYKKAAEDIDTLPRVERDVHPVIVEFPHKVIGQRPPDVSMDELLRVFAEVLHRAQMFADHHIEREPLSVRERMSRVLDIAQGEFVPFVALFTVTEGRSGVVVTLIAVLELMKESLLELVQNEPRGPIYVRAVGSTARSGEGTSTTENEADGQAAD
ncbi:MAG: segregation/condensation protein A [Gammaproteobacteria bacterium]|nr:segregation/condensation protein A [Gammaproteobacteria bacterium]